MFQRKPELHYIDIERFALILQIHLVIRFFYHDQSKAQSKEKDHYEHHVQTVNILPNTSELKTSVTTVDADMHCQGCDDVHGVLLAQLIDFTALKPRRKSQCLDSCCVKDRTHTAAVNGVGGSHEVAENDY